MSRYLLIVIFLISTNAQTDNNSSVVNQSWFWPILAISLALLLSIPSTLIILVCIYFTKHKSNDDRDGSSTHSTSSMPQRQSRHVEGFRSPPPPYTTCERPENLFMTSSLAPSYVSHVNENLPTSAAVSPTENLAHTTTTTTVLDLSSTLTSPSIQTFQA